MDKNNLAAFHQAVADAAGYINAASTDFLQYQLQEHHGALARSEQEMIVGAWLSALTTIKDRVLKNAEALGYDVVGIELQEIVQEKETLETWFRNAREKNENH